MDSSSASNDNSINQMDIEHHMSDDAFLSQLNNDNNNLEHSANQQPDGTNDITQQDDQDFDPAADPVMATAGQQLIDFLKYLEDYKPTVPDAVTSHIMQTAGFNTNDPRILRLASLATQKFIADIANDALQHCKMRTAISQNKKAPKDKRYTLTFEDLVPVLSDYGINIKKPQYYY